MDSGFDTPGRRDARPTPTGTCAATAATCLETALANRLAPAALFLDVDGTLLDIADTPEAVVVPPGLPALLAAIARELDGAVALVSGREIGSLDRLFGPLPIAMCGVHGAQWRHVGSDHLQVDAALLLPDALRETLIGLGDEFAGVRVEDKRFSVAIHYRGTAHHGESVARRVRAIVAAAQRASASGAGGGFRLLPGKMLVEVKRAGYDKSAALARFLQERPFTGRRPVYVGDDVTDEVAIAWAAAHDGIGLSVGRPMAGACAVFDAPASVRAALAAVAASAAGRAAGRAPGARAQ